ncbi:MAG: hypothetical protein HY683_01480 [Chloroflexi bacterium]|nr:hypothetical protein [Chloroflexota bacterium]
MSRLFRWFGHVRQRPWYAAFAILLSLLAFAAGMALVVALDLGSRSQQERWGMVVFMGFAVGLAFLVGTNVLLELLGLGSRNKGKGEATRQ